MMDGDDSNPFTIGQVNAFECIVSGREMFDCLVCEVEYANETYSTKLRKSAEGANGIICKRRAAYKNDESRE
jgi:hypothetical protein